MSELAAAKQPPLAGIFGKGGAEEEEKRKEEKALVGKLSSFKREIDVERDAGGRAALLWI